MLLRETSACGLRAPSRTTDKTHLSHLTPELAGDLAYARLAAARGFF